ncbi:MAG TPA: ABC transporter substrate-binding protein [Trebonia sp.]|jgi:NitT/TauT family transport system substrate-binding protein
MGSKESTIRRRVRRPAGALCLTAAALAAATALAACSSGGTSSATSAATSAATAAGASGKSLSLNSVTVVGNFATGFAPLWVAQSEGFFKSQGLNVTLKDLNTGGASGAVTALLGGTGQFLVVAAGATSLAVSGGAPIKAVMQSDFAPIQQIAISSSVAAAKGIPASATTAAGTEAQLKALKGSHIKLATTSKSGNSYIILQAVLHQYGLSTGDVTVETEPSSSVQISLLKSGQVDGIVNSPPVTSQAGTDLIELDKVPPVSAALSDLVSTTSTMVSQHPDTVQAFVNAVTEGAEWIQKNPSQVVTALSPLFKADGISDAATVKYLATEQAAHIGPSRVILESAYNNTLAMGNLANPTTPVKVAFSSWIDNSFAQNAVKTNG